MTGRTPSLSIVIPAFNEAARIRGTLEELRTHLSGPAFPWEIRVVDDGSADDTVAIVRHEAASDPRIVLQAEPHRGKGGAVRAGMLAATADVRFLCDADLSMPLHELPRFLQEVPGRCDIAIGSREGAGSRRVGEPHHRHTVGRAFNLFLRALGLTSFNDTQCGFKLFSATAAEAVFRRVSIEGWAFDVEALFIAKQLGLRVRELPIEWHYQDRSQISPVRDSAGMARDAMRIRVNAVRGQYR